MGSDFYKRSRELFEEFQKRELHYLNTESIYSDRFHITSDSSLPVQEYLQKLNKREKESEDTYRGLMTHMEELDRRTESISAKLEKLNSLRTSMSLKFGTWSSSSNNFDQQYPNYSHTSNILQSNQDFKYLSALKTNQDFTFPCTSPVTQVKDVTCSGTQTDIMFCENCHFPISISSGALNASCSLSAVPNTSISTLQNTSLTSSIDADLPQVLNPPTDFVHQDANLKLNLSQTMSQPSNDFVHQNTNLNLIPSQTISQPSSDFVHQNTNLNLNPPQVISQPSNDFMLQNTNLKLNPSQTVIQPNEYVPQSMLILNKEEGLKSVAIPPVAKIPIVSTKETEIDSHISDKKDCKPSMDENPSAENVAVSKTVISITDDIDLINERNPSIDDTISFSDGIDKIISKSDDESLNHEFDFLDSDKRSQRRTIQTKQETLPQASKGAINNLTTTQESVENDLAISQIDKDNLHQSSKNPTYNPKNTYEADDKQSESSISIGGAHSPSLRSENLSAVSDSDSLYEKEDSHIKTSAAYQALLGNVPIAKSVQQSAYSESEFEDEIEKAIANTHKKKRKVSTNSASKDEKVQDNNKSVPESKPKMEPRKSISGGKSQQLSKTTRKVLGLDTSSGSEGEVKLEANVKKKIEEDSDEFDFYD